jgi:hypothetical protein
MYGQADVTRTFSDTGITTKSLSVNLIKIPIIQTRKNNSSKLLFNRRRTTVVFAFRWACFGLLFFFRVCGVCRLRLKKSQNVTESHEKSIAIWKEKQQ